MIVFSGEHIGLSDSERVELIIDLIDTYGNMSGQKPHIDPQWLVDQILRAVMPDEDSYDDFIETAFENNWSRGQAPEDKG